MEVDTGAAVSVISGKKKETLFPNLPLRRAGSALKTYTGQNISVLGELHILEVGYSTQRVRIMFLLVVFGGGLSSPW